MSAEAHQSEIVQGYGKLGLVFEPNVGQTDECVDFVARADGYTAFLTRTGAVFAIENSEVRIPNSKSQSELSLPTARPSPVTTHPPTGVALYMEIVGANLQADVVGHGQLPGKVNYFIGNDSSHWRTNIATYEGVEYNDIYPGIDLVYYGKDQQLEYDFIVAPGISPNIITLNFSGASTAQIDGDGNLVLHTAAGDVVQPKPYVYQEVNGLRNEVTGRFAMRTRHSPLTTHQVTFELGSYDVSLPLVIDPLVMGYSTYLGASGLGIESAYGVAVDGDGNAFVTGYTDSVNFPITPGAFDANLTGNTDVFVAKLSADGSALLYASYLGGSVDDVGYRIDVDGSGNPYLIGYTSGADFPTTAGAHDETFNGRNDVFVTKLSADGDNVLYSTYLGGAADDVGRGLAVDATGNAYLVGWTFSANFPTTTGVFDTTHNAASDVFVARLNAGGNTLVYSTFLGASHYEWGTGIAVNDDGNAFVTGYTQSFSFPTTPGAYDTTYNGGSRDAFVTKMASDGTSLVYSTLIGASDGDWGRGIGLDAGGHAYVTGFTDSSDYPTTPGAFDTTYNGGVFDIFVTRLNFGGSALDYSTFLGGEGDDSRTGSGIAIDAVGNAYITGVTESTNFPTTPGAFDFTYAGGKGDAFLTKLNPSGTSLRYSSYLGGSKFDRGLAIDVDASGSAYLVGETGSTDYPTTQGAFKRRHRGNADAFVTKFAEV